jgi:hypothetical protein
LDASEEMSRVAPWFEQVSQEEDEDEEKRQEKQGTNFLKFNSFSQP